MRTINFMAGRHIAMAITLVLTLLSVGAIATKGFNFGLDFTGGTLIELSYAESVELDSLREVLHGNGYEDAVVQSFGSITDVLIRTPGDDPDLGRKLEQLLRDTSTQEFVVKQVEFVGPAVGEELRDDGGMGMLVALGGILVYLGFRFQWKFGVAAVVALFHDVIITLGVLSWLQIQFDLTVLAAVLAVIGYSLNDTIVVFDRVRENFRLLRNTSLLDNINISTTQTLLRTLATSLSTALAVAALLFFGGINLYGFSLTLLVGIAVGTYSSIYVSNAMLPILKLTVEDLIPPVVEHEVDDAP